MKKYLSLLSILTLGGAVSPLINSTITNHNNTKLLKSLEDAVSIKNGINMQQLWKNIESVKEDLVKKNNVSTNSVVNSLAGQVMGQVLAQTPISGAGFTALLPCGIVTGLLAGALAAVISVAVSIARAIPLLGPQVVLVIGGFGLQNLSVANPDQKLTEGTNKVPVNFNFGGQIFSSVATVTGVQAASANPNEVSGQILSGALASTPIEGSGLTSGLPISVVTGIVPGILAGVIALAMGIAASLPIIGEIVVGIIGGGLLPCNIIPINGTTQKLTEGNNQVPVNLDVAGKSVESTLNVTNVGKQSTNPTQIAGQLVASAIASTPIEGSGLTSGLPISVVTGIVPGLLAGVIATVVALAESLIGPLFPQVIVVVKGLNVTNIVPSGDPNQKLTEGNNQVPVDLDFGGQITKTGLNVTNVGKESSDPTQIASSILVSVLAKTPIDCSILAGVVAGVAVTEIISIVVTAVLAVVVAAALAVVASLGSIAIAGQIIAIIKGLSVSNITAVDATQKLTAGTNQVPTNLNLGGTSQQTTLLLSGVKTA